MKKLKSVNNILIKSLGWFRVIGGELCHWICWSYQVHLLYLYSYYLLLYMMIRSSRSIHLVSFCGKPIWTIRFKRMLWLSSTMYFSIFYLYNSYHKKIQFRFAFGVSRVHLYGKFLINYLSLKYLNCTCQIG